MHSILPSKTDPKIVVTTLQSGTIGNSRIRFILLGSLILFLVGPYFEILSWVVEGWFRSNRSYSIIILALSVYMVIRRKDSLLHTPVDPNLFMGGLTTFFGSSMVIIGKLTSTLMIQGFSFVITLIGLVWLLLGSKHLRILLVPVGYLFFMFYLLEELLNNFTEYFQLITAWIAANLLRAGGMTVALHGDFIQLPHIVLKVAKVCNGVNHIVALTALAVPVAFLSHRSVKKKFLIILAAFLTGILANGIRVALIGLWTKYRPGAPIHGPFDILYVSFILVFGLSVFSIAGIISSRRQYAFKSGSPVSTDCKRDSKKPGRTINRQRISAIIAIVILVSTNTYIYGHHPLPVDPQRDLNELPLQLGDWQAKTIFDKNFPIEHVNADIELRRIYKHADGERLGLYVGYFQAQEQGKELINNRLDWLYTKASKVRLDVYPRVEGIMRGTFPETAENTQQDRAKCFYFWYQIDNRIYCDPHEIKAAVLFNNLLHKRSNGALVMVSVEEYGRDGTLQDEIEFLQYLIPLLREYI